MSTKSDKYLYLSLEVVYKTFGNPVFCLALYLTGVRFQGEFQYVGHVGGQKIKCRPIRTQEIGGVRLQEELYVLYLIPAMLLRQLNFGVWSI